MNLPSISIIVPVYNVEPYLRRCVNSIINQTYKNLDIILVDDGSTDHSGEICDEYAAKDNRIKVIHRENGGLSAARNTGLSISKGEYVYFVDSDDYIEIETCEIALNCAIKHQADIVCFGYREIYPSGQVKTFVMGSSGIMEKPAIIGALVLGERGLRDYVWNKMFSKRLFENIRFPVGRTFEDIFVMHRLFDSAHIIYIITNILYNYNRRDGSITSNGIVVHDLLYVMNERLEFLNYSYPEYLIKFLADFLQGMIILIDQMAKGTERDDLSDDINNIINRHKSKMDDISKHSRIVWAYLYYRPLSHSMIKIRNFRNKLLGHYHFF